MKVVSASRPRSAEGEAGVPVVDLAAAHAGVPGAMARAASQIDAANREVGFFCVEGHGVDAAVIDAMHDAARRFFALDDEEKHSSTAAPGQGTRGYVPAGGRRLARSLGADSPPDLRETFSMARPVAPDDPCVASPDDAELFRPPRWPLAVPEMAPAWTAYYRAMEELAGSLLDCFAEALALPPGWFDTSCERHCSSLLANHYPPIDEALAPGQLRAGAHTDYGSFTVLFEDGSPGLEVCVDGCWTPVNPPSGSFVVNLGDLIARWTNDRWVSTLHRVVPGPRPDGGRISVPFFHQPAADALIECIPTCAGTEGPRYPPITSGQNWRDKMTRTASA